MSNTIQERVLSVAERKIESFVIEKVTELTGDRSDLQEARQQEKQAKAQALARAAASGDSDGSSSSTTREATSPEAIDQLAAEEDCPICESILEQIKTFPDPKRTKGVAEYGEFRSAIEESEAAAEATLADSEVLVDALGNVSEVPT
jgi:hypothetical protein